MGKTLVAPVVTYVPEGSWENLGGHMAKPGTITLPEDRFVELLVSAGRSLKAGGFKKIWFLGESGGNRTGMRTAAEKLNALWNGAATAYWVDDYYTKAHARAEHVGGEVPEGRRRSGRQPRQHPRHLGAAVRRAEAHSPRSPDRQRLREQRRQRQQPGEVHAGSRQGAAADQDRSRARADQADERRQRAAGRRGAGAARRRRWPRRRGPRRPAGRGRPRPPRPTMETAPAVDDADQGARHRVHRRADVGRDARCDEGRQDRVHRAHRRHREERLPHGDGQT